jgi:MSHA biogenesis protein MshO
MATYARSGNHQRGFTLIELIMVIILMGVIGGIVAVFMKGPIDAYLDSGRRAALTDVADTAVRRIARDLQRALPNSVRTSGANCLEFIPTKSGGRYRADGPGALDFSTAVSSFHMLGQNSALPPDQQIASGDMIVVYNLGVDVADAYYTPTASNNTATVTGTPSESGTAPDIETTISLAATKQFPLASGSNRFHVVSSTEKLVSYVCSGGNLYRTIGSTLSTTPSCAASGSIIASNVNCGGTSFSYSGSDLQRNALVTMVLSIQDSSGTESVNLQHEVHVDNTP